MSKLLKLVFVFVYNGHVIQSVGYQNGISHKSKILHGIKMAKDQKLLTCTSLYCQYQINNITYKMLVMTFEFYFWNESWFEMWCLTYDGYSFLFKIYLLSYGNKEVIQICIKNEIYHCVHKSEDLFLTQGEKVICRV